MPDQIQPTQPPEPTQPTEPVQPIQPVQPTQPAVPGQGLAITSMVLGIIGVVSFIWFPIAMILGILAIIFGILGLKSRGRGKALAGIITGSIALLLGVAIILLAFVVAPMLQKSTNDTSIKNDVSLITTEVMSYQSNNQGQLPTEYADILPSRLQMITLVRFEGTPTSSTAIYTIGTSCEGVTGTREFSVTALLSDDVEYCQGS